MRDLPHTTGGRSFERTLLAAVTLWLAFSGELGRASDLYSEESVKAAFVLRFTSYVTWLRPTSSSAPLKIAVLGDKVMVARLQALVENRSVSGRPIDIMQVKSPAEARTAHLLYIGSERSTDLPMLLSALGGCDILTVTDAPDGLRAGGVINFLTVDQRVRFEVSMEAAHRAGLAISSELLSAAVRVQGRQAQALSSAGEHP